MILTMGFENALASTFDSFSGLLSHTTTLAMNHLIRATFAFYNSVHHAEIVPMNPEFDEHISINDAHLLPEIIARGEAAAEAELPYLLSVLSSPIQA